MTGIGRVEGAPRFLQEQTERPRPRVIRTSEVKMEDVMQMAELIGARTGLSDSYSAEVPYLEHPSGVRIKFAEEIHSILNPYRVTTISFEAVHSPKKNKRRIIQREDVVLEDVRLEIFGDAVVFKSPGVVWEDGIRVDVEDSFILSRNGYKHERTIPSNMY